MSNRRQLRGCLRVSGLGHLEKTSPPEFFLVVFETSKRPALTGRSFAVELLRKSNKILIKKVVHDDEYNNKKFRKEVNIHHWLGLLRKILPISTYPFVRGRFRCLTKLGFLYTCFQYNLTSWTEVLIALFITLIMENRTYCSELQCGRCQLEM